MLQQAIKTIRIFLPSTNSVTLQQIEDAVDQVLHIPSYTDLDKDVLISSIVRDGKIILPKGQTKLDAHDTLFILAQSSKIDSIIKQINGAS